jgi:hypothetical protein
MQKPFLKILFVFALAAATSLSGCKKDSASTQEKLIGKWPITGIDYHDFFDGESETYSEIPVPGSYYQFNSDGTLVAHTDADYAGTWELKNNTLIITDPLGIADTTALDIKKITATEMDLYIKEVDSLNYLETTIHLKK